MVLYLDDSLSFMRIVKTQIHSGKVVCRKFLLVITEESDDALPLVAVLSLEPEGAGVLKSFAVPSLANPDDR